MDWIITLVIGGVIGWLASLVMKTDAQMGLLGNIVIGIIGSALGFWLAGALGLGATSKLGGYLVAVAGAAVLIGLLKALGVLK